MPIGIDIFSGAGGLSLGAEMAGLQIKFAVENDKPAAETYRYNHPDTLLLEEDIHGIDPTDYLQTGEHISIVFGGPPCQGFSASNTMTRNMKNPNNSLFQEFVRFVSVILPDWFLFENVEGFVHFEKGRIQNLVEDLFRGLGYKVSSCILCASDYGVPQRRNRFFMIGNRMNIDFEFPDKQDTIVTVSEAIDDLPDLTNGQMLESAHYKIKTNKASKYARLMRHGSRRSSQNFVSHYAEYVIDRYRHIGQGQNWRAIPDDLMLNYTNKANCHSGIYKRLKADEPSIVISNYRKNMLIHPYQDRGLSVREAARLQSFPDKFIFKGRLMSIQQQIGNAVPPLLAKAVFKKINCYIHDIF